MRKQLLLLGAALGVEGASSGGSATAKVLDMLAEMIQRGQKEKKSEMEMFDKIEDTVHKQLIELKLDIERQGELIEKYSAAEDSNTAAAEEQEATAAKLTKENAGNQKVFDSRTKQRKETKAEFTKEHKDLTAAVAALRNAHATLKAGQGSVDAVFLQTLSESLPAGTLAMLEGPKGKAYETQSGGIVEILKGLLDDFKGQLQDCEKAEANRQHSYELFSLDMKDELDNVNNQIADATERAGDHRQKAGKAKAQKEAAMAALAEAQKSKKETESYMTMNEAAFKANQKYRTEELAALTEARKIIADQASKFVQVAASFVQVNSAFLQSQKKTQLLLQTNDFIMKASANLTHRSPALALVAANLLAGGPFDKIMGLIQDLIKKLEAEAKAEGAHMAWCAESKRDTRKELDELNSIVEKASAKKKQLTSDRADQEERQKELQGQVAQHNADIKSRTEERLAEKAENEQTIKDAQEGQTAIEKAISVLESFYQKGSLLQEEQPQIAAYKGMGDTGGGVIGLLETIESDFARLEAETTAQEGQKSQEHNEFMAETKAVIAQKKQAISDAKVEIINLNGKLKLTNKTLRVKGKEQAAAQKYWDELQPMCTIKTMSYEEKKAQRDAEIAAMKEAYAILTEEMQK